MQALKSLFYRFIFIGFCLMIAILIGFLLFKPIYLADSIIIPYSLHPYDICISYPLMWKNLKLYFILFYCMSTLLCSNCLYSILYKKVFKKRKVKKAPNIAVAQNSLSLFVGKNESDNLVFIPEKSLYQNIFISGTIGSGKTSSCMYPFTKQLMSVGFNNSNKKIGMLILDVKGNFYKEVLRFANFYNRLDDVCIIQLGGNIKYNPLDKPNLKPSVIANRLKIILTLFSPNNSESYWLDEIEKVLTEAIKFCRLYNNGYVTFVELHKLVTVPDYFMEKLELIKDNFTLGKLSKKDCYDAFSSIDFFQKEFFALDNRTLSIIKSEITRITNCFVSDYDILHTFCPTKEEINFTGFNDLIDKR